MNKIYFDTDVLIHLLISQEPDKANLAYPLYKEATDNNQFFISLLCLQEVAYVLHRLGQQPDNIERILRKSAKQTKHTKPAIRKLLKNQELWRLKSILDNGVG